MRIVSRVKEQSSTSGLSSYELASSGALYRRFRDEHVTGERVRYIAASSSDFEEGLGILSYGTPDVLSRDTIIRSSQSGAKINWPAGTRDVFIDPLPGSHPVLSQSGAYTVTVFDLGALIRFTGTTATWGLPAAASVGDGWSCEVKNDGTGDLTIDAAGSELINGALTAVIKPGSSGLFRCSGTAWFAVGLSALDINGLAEDTSPDLSADFIPAYDVNAAGNRKWLASRLLPQIGTLQNSTSGTLLDFTAIPAWAKRIEVAFNQVSTNAAGTAHLLLQLGDSGGVEATGYTSTVAQLAGTTFTAQTIGFRLTDGLTAARVLSGHATLTLMSAASNLWCCHSVLIAGDNGYVQAGTKALSATLDRLRITTSNGTDAFDAGSVNVLFH